MTGSGEVEAVEVPEEDSDGRRKEGMIQYHDMNTCRITVLCRLIGMERIYNITYLSHVNFEPDLPVSIQNNTALVLVGAKSLSYDLAFSLLHTQNTPISSTPSKSDNANNVPPAQEPH